MENAPCSLSLSSPFPSRVGGSHVSLLKDMRPSWEWAKILFQECSHFNYPGVVNRTQSNLISIELNRTQSNSIGGLSSTIEWNRTHRKVKKSIEPNRTFDFRTLDLCKTYVENPLPDLRSSSYFSPECSARVFRKRRNSAEMASDALWIVSFKCIVKGYQECRFDVKDGEVFRILKKIGEKGRAFRIANERGQLGHLQRELVASLWPVNASITW